MRVHPLRAGGAGCSGHHQCGAQLSCIGSEHAAVHRCLARSCACWPLMQCLHSSGLLTCSEALLLNMLSGPSDFPSCLRRLPVRHAGPSCGRRQCFSVCAADLQARVPSWPVRPEVSTQRSAGVSTVCLSQFESHRQAPCCAAACSAQSLVCTGPCRSPCAAR